MFKYIFALVLISTVYSCAGNSKNSTNPPPSVDFFANKKGCFLLYNLKTKNFDKVIGEGACREQFPACSTFKVPLAIIAFDSGILKDENIILKWDGVKRSREELNHDHNAKTWMRDSIVWFSQRITSSLGKERFQSYLNTLNYGNKDLSGGLTEAWLVSPNGNTPALKISAYEQVEFMKNLWTDSLHFSKRALQLTRDITYLETSPKGFKLSGKTGTNFYDKDQKIHLGWFIAHISNEKQEYIAVTNFSDLGPTKENGYGGARAKEITKKILESEGLW